LLLQEIKANLAAAMENAMRLIRRAVEMIPQRREELMTCPATRALELAVWSDKSKIDAEEVKRLSPLWGRYF
jgi:hypothetical protein